MTPEGRTSMSVMGEDEAFASSARQFSRLNGFQVWLRSACEAATGSRITVRSMAQMAPEEIGLPGGAERSVLPRGAWAESALSSLQPEGRSRLKSYLSLVQRLD